MHCIIAAQRRLRSIYTFEQAAIIDQSAAIHDPNPVANPEETTLAQFPAASSSLLKSASSAPRPEPEKP